MVILCVSGNFGFWSFPFLGRTYFVRDFWILVFYWRAYFPQFFSTSPTLLFFFFPREIAFFAPHFLTNPPPPQDSPLYFCILFPRHAPPPFWFSAPFFVPSLPPPLHHQNTAFPFVGPLTTPPHLTPSPPPPLHPRWPFALLFYAFPPPPHHPRSCSRSFGTFLTPAFPTAAPRHSLLM